MDSIRWPAILAVAIVGAFVAYLALGRATPQRNAPVAHMTPSTAMSAPRRDAPPVAAVPPESAAAPRPALGPPPVQDEGAPEDDTAQRQAPPASDRMSRKDVRVLVERAFKGKLPDRELTPADYDRLVDDVMQLRSAVRAIRRADKAPNAAATASERKIMITVMADIEAVTGVPPSELGTALAADDDNAAEPDAGDDGPPDRTR